MTHEPLCYDLEADGQLKAALLALRGELRQLRSSIYDQKYRAKQALDSHKRLREQESLMSALSAGHGAGGAPKKKKSLQELIADAKKARQG